MKFKCTDCGCEYEIKPDYCDCGNDVFEKIAQPQKSIISPQVQEPKKEKIKFKKDFDYIGWGIFFTCIFLAILSIMFLGNGILKKAEESAKTQKPILQPNKNIPSIESIWEISTTPQPTTQANKIVKNPVVKTQPKKQTPKIVTKKPVQKQAQQTTQTQPIKTIPKVDVQKYIPQTQTPTPQPTVKPVEQKPVVDLVAQQQELLQYKIALRNRIASKMDFAQVIGDGNCKITFKINSSGALIDRKFSQQSTNISLNDVVYKAMMQNPAYKTPPEGYKNETLTLSVKIYGGNFEIDLR